MEFPEGYPTSQEILAEEGDDKWMPASLQLLMKTLLPANPLQRKCFGQCIVQILKPRKAIPPIPYGIGVSLDMCVFNFTIHNRSSTKNWSTLHTNHHIRPAAVVEGHVHCEGGEYADCLYSTC